LRRNNENFARKFSRDLPFSLSTVNELSVPLGSPSHSNAGDEREPGRELALVSTSPSIVVGMPLPTVEAVEEVTGCSPSSRSVERAANVKEVC